MQGVQRDIYPKLGIPLYIDRPLMHVSCEVQYKD